MAESGATVKLPAQSQRYKLSAVDLQSLVDDRARLRGPALHERGVVLRESNLLRMSTKRDLLTSYRFLWRYEFSISKCPKNRSETVRTTWYLMYARVQRWKGQSALALLSALR